MGYYASQVAEQGDWMALAAAIRADARDAAEAALDRIARDDAKLREWIDRGRHERGPGA